MLKEFHETPEGKAILTSRKNGFHEIPEGKAILANIRKIWKVSRNPRGESASVCENTNNHDPVQKTTHITVQYVTRKLVCCVF